MNSLSLHRVTKIEILPVRDIDGTIVRHVHVTDDQDVTLDITLFANENSEDITIKI